MNDIPASLRSLARQEQFLDVVDRDEAERRFRKHLELRPLGCETVPLAQALGRVVARRVVAGVDVPGFDRASVDGFAVHADGTLGASERTPRRLTLLPEILTPGKEPRLAVEPGTATLIATGGMVPRGADAVVMVEHTETAEAANGATVLEIRRAATAGQFVAFAGSDMARGETVLRAGQVLTSREIGMLAAVGCATVEVWRRPRVAIISTGDEIIAPGAPMRPGAVFDSNAAILAAAVEEAGGVSCPLGIGADDDAVLTRLVEDGLAACDVVILSGGTSKGAGDLCYRAVARFRDPGIVVHGVALKPGKPLCLAVTRGKPVVVLPGFPTSAIFTFHEFVAPVVRAFAGLAPERAERLPATLPLRVASERGRTEYLMVSLIQGDPEGTLFAYPNIKGSGAVTAFSQADGFIAVDAQVESVAAGTPVEVQLIGDAHLADLVIIGSHCVGLDILIDRLHAEGIAVKALNIGSMGGLAAAKRGECDIAAIHLMDPETGGYNRPFLTPALELVPGYRRLQGIVYRSGDPRFDHRSVDGAIAAVLAAPDCLMVNRNAGSGTRILTDRLLGGARPPGYWAQPKSHNAVAAAVAQNRADWGIAIESVARQYGLGFIPAQDEHYDFVIPRNRIERPAILRFRALLAASAVREALASLGFVM
ncbi:MAG TPA: molybdopterin biosynthesis protein [Stellaceae bacterium]|jgi:putative molybdopterin biosynthesis protein|nr:molybdopterin biosynthesis protein [Stellaceae bacterium]